MDAAELEETRMAFVGIWDFMGRKAPLLFSMIEALKKDRDSWKEAHEIRSKDCMHLKSKIIGFQEALAPVRTIYAEQPTPSESDEFDGGGCGLKKSDIRRMQKALLDSEPPAADAPPPRPDPTPEQYEEARGIINMIEAGGMDTALYLGSILAEKEAKAKAKEG